MTTVTELGGRGAAAGQQTLPRTLFVRAYRLLARIGRRRRAAVFGIAIFTIAFRLLLSAVLPHPEPAYHDEFSYLLGAELFASGHVAGPVHPLWKFFESMHVLSRPVYASKYPPAQAAFLAIGIVLFHDPFYGVLFSVALFAAASCWMLQAFVRPAWALLGGLCTALTYGAGHYWTESYWGGAVTALGAALAVGAFGRVREMSSIRFGCAFGAGVALLVNSRPYESSTLIVMMVTALAVGALRNTYTRARSKAVAAGIALAAAGAVTGAYNYEVTGDPLLMPYVLHMKQYIASQPLWFMPPPPPKHYENASLEHCYVGFDGRNYEDLRSMPPLKRAGVALGKMLLFSIGNHDFWGFLILFFIPLFWRDSQVRLLASSLLALIATLALETAVYFHYMTPVLVLAIATSWVLFDRIWRFRPAKRIKPAERVALCTILAGLFMIGPVWNAAAAVRGVRGEIYDGSGFAYARANLVRDLIARGGGHVIFVRFNPSQDPADAWVANGARIDSQPVVWAHDRGPSANRALLAYFKGRTFWLLEMHGRQMSLVPYVDARNADGTQEDAGPPAR
jgi:hypothetical protein